MSKVYDQVIIGQGMAGSLLGYHLSKNGQDILVVDDEGKVSSSKVAAGIINPIKGRRPNNDPLFELLLEKAISTYKDLEQDFNKRIITPHKQIRIFKDKVQREKWLSEHEHGNYILEVKKQSFPHLKLPFGGCLIAHSYIVDVPMILENVRTYLQEKNQISHFHIQYDQIEIGKDTIQIGAIETKRLIFCEGASVINNPFFPEIEMEPAKGEIVVLDIPQLEPNIYNWGRWLVPTSQGQFKLGSNYLWNDFTDTTYKNTKEDLLTEMQDQFTLPLAYDVIDHISGIRPTTKDRNPVVVQHKEFENIFCLNGFGSKGCLAIPFFMEQFLGSF